MLDGDQLIVSLASACNVIFGSETFQDEFCFPVLSEFWHIPTFLLIIEQKPILKSLYLDFFQSFAFCVVGGCFFLIAGSIQMVVWNYYNDVYITAKLKVAGATGLIGAIVFFIDAGISLCLHLRQRWRFIFEQKPEAMQHGPLSNKLCSASFPIARMCFCLQMWVGKHKAINEQGNSIFRTQT